jgi:hypothetical protein
MAVSSKLHAPVAFPQERSPSYPSDSRLDGPRGDLGAVENKKICFHLPGIEPRWSSPYPSHYIDSYISAPTEGTQKSQQIERKRATE